MLSLTSMQKRAIYTVSGVVLAAVLAFAWYVGTARHELAVNPDPNHTHADFAIWVKGEKLDFSGAEYMSGVSTETAHENEKDKYLHLHDAVDYVLHRHKPGLMFGNFMVTNLGLNLAHDVKYGAKDAVSADIFCLFKDSVRTLPADGTAPAKPEVDSPCISGNMRTFVNGEEMPPLSLMEYDFQDGDHILITDAVDSVELQRHMNAMTDDACKYSKTCPWKGAPPTENCIADPEVPCVVQ